MRLSTLPPLLLAFLPACGLLTSSEEEQAAADERSETLADLAEFMQSELAANPEKEAGQEPEGEDGGFFAEMRSPQERFGEHILEHPNGEVSVFLAVPVGFGAELADRLKRLCDICSIGTAEAPIVPGVSITVEEGAGRVLHQTDLSKSDSNPADAIASMKPVEDWVVLRGLPDALEEPLRFVDLFYASSPQIEIEARVLEITHSGKLDLGVQGLTARPVDEAGAAYPQPGQGPLIKELGGGTSLESELASAGGLFTFSAIQDGLQLQGLLQALASQENVDIVAFPRIAVRNGVKAVVESGDQYPILKDIRLSSSGDVTSSAVGYEDTGVHLYAVPFILGRDTILMDLEVELTVASTTLELAADVSSPIFTTRKAKTIVQVRNEQIIVIGGLLHKEKRKAKNKIPILGDIPLLGALFRSTSDIEVSTTVMFMIKPTIRGDGVQPFGDILDPTMFQ